MQSVRIVVNFELEIYSKHWNTKHLSFVLFLFYFSRRTHISINEFNPEWNVRSFFTHTIKLETQSKALHAQKQQKNTVHRKSGKFDRRNEYKKKFTWIFLFVLKTTKKNRRTNLLINVYIVRTKKSEKYTQNRSRISESFVVRFAFVVYGFEYEYENRKHLKRYIT